MALHGCMRFMKYLVFVFNFIVWLTGMAVLGFAIWLRMDPKITNYVRAGFDKDLHDYYLMCYILMAAGGVMTFVGFLGCCGAFQESKCMLGTFFVFLFIIFSAEVTGGVWAYINWKNMRQQGLETFEVNIQTKYGKVEAITSAVNYVQTTLKCCGVDNAGDWDETMWAQLEITNVGRVPQSCCNTDMPAPKGTSLGLCGTGGSWQGEGRHTALWNKGCGEELMDFLQLHLVMMMTTSVAIGAIQFLGMSFSLMLCCAMRRSRGGGYKS